ncbi:S1C family serine protease [Lewinella sp. W8]|uniref:S1C family serine protease n=1 Tax=Lewinella sp. W8 TaxID=2528208 RepID=UPI001068AC7E|nr:trypsin-like peptidase domain-containing protein [Lewinella sp. W8]MTB50578.1 PDZ domain-containing protein [Lewinella sp. W8]
MQPFYRLLLAALLGGLLAAGATVLLLEQRLGGAIGLLPDDAPRPKLVNLAPGAGQLRHYPEPVDLRSAARLATKTVVHITARADGDGRETVKALFGRQRRDADLSGGEGSGVIYTSNGYIVTNYHVVAGANQITVTTTDRRRYPASLIGEDPKSDLAVLKIEGDNFPYLPLADSDAVEPGAWVLAVGNPLGLTSTVTAGIISAKGRNLSLLPDLDAIESFLQTDAAVNPGNSGGPLVTAEGKLVGINTAIASQTGRFQGYSFAIPVNLVQRIADDIIEFGAYRRAYLGVEISTLTPADIRRMRLKNQTQGVLIDAIFAGGSAEAAGLQVGDLVVKVDDRQVNDLPEMTEIIGLAKVGDQLKVTVIRDNTPREIVVTMLPFQE